MTDSTRRLRGLLVGCTASVLIGATLLAFGQDPQSPPPATPLQQLLTTRKCLNCDLTNIDFTLKDLSGVSVAGAVFTGSTLYKTNLTGADLSGANLQGVNIGGAILTGAKLYNADLSGADISFAVDANLTGVTTDAKTTCPNYKKGPCS